MWPCKGDFGRESLALLEAILALAKMTTAETRRAAANYVKWSIRTRTGIADGAVMAASDIEYAMWMLCEDENNKVKENIG